MELKNVTLLLTTLCVVSIVFIILVEFYQSRSLSSRWNRPKNQFEVSKYAHNALFENDNDEHVLPPNPMKDQKVNNRLLMTKVGNEWTTETSGTTLKQELGAKTATTARTDYEHVKVKVKTKKRQRLMKLKEYDGSLSEEEKLKMSPYIYHEEQEHSRLSTSVAQSGIKYISYFLPWELGRMKKGSFKRCRHNKCAFVLDMSQADLVAFAANHLRDYGTPSYQRPLGQRWLMYTIDPAIRDFDLGRNDIRSMFNDTHTYNLDSDIPFIFGRLRKKVPAPIRDYERLYESKTKSVAWFVSHCTTASRREDFVERMQSILNVDIFGECGNMTCGGSKGFNSRSLDAAVCLPMLTNTYKFYLAFENAYCLDYITEKFFKLFQGIQIIPVVRGGFQYKKYLPSGIFVDADDFRTPEQLAQHLLDLGNDKQRYVEMLRRKDEWGVMKPRARECVLCEYLHSNPPNKFYPDLQKKFGVDSCFYPKKL